MIVVLQVVEVLLPHVGHVAHDAHRQKQTPMRRKVASAHIAFDEPRLLTDHHFIYSHSM